MRCRQCDYQLWSLEARRCPECGLPFVPSQYEFLPNAVRFCCPHCRQTYYGTDAKGHLEPPEFPCVSCGRHIHMDEMVLLPVEGLEDVQTQAACVPWLDRARRGLFRAWFRTVGMALAQPGRLMNLVPEQTSVASGMWLATWTAVVSMLIASIPFLAVAAFPAMSAGAGAWEMSAPLIFFLGAALLGVPLVSGLWALIAHGLLRLTGTTATGLKRTLQAITFTGATLIVLAVPCFGFYFGWIWWVISAAIGVKEAQRVSSARAAFAVLTPPFLLIGGVVTLYIWVVATALSGAGSLASVQSPSGSDNLHTMVVALKGYSDSHNGETPVHSLRLLESGDLTADEFVSVDSPTMTDDVTIGEKTLEDLQYLPEDQLGAAVQAAADRLPAGVVAHRVGDYVFTYHGINLKGASNRLWLVIESPEPTQAGAGADRTIRVIGADRISTTYTALAFDAALEEQNTRRRLRSLPPLPHPDTVTAARPAVAPQDAQDR